VRTHELYQVGRALIDASRRAQGADQRGVSLSESLVLGDLLTHQQSSISEIVARTGIAQSRVSVCIQSLVRSGWVLTTADPADGRKTLARVTDRVQKDGKKRRAHGAKDALAPLLTRCSPKERKAITRALDRLYALTVDTHDERLKEQRLVRVGDPGLETGTSPLSGASG
jgi:DNA-binding MarR family transcriptional regulator